MVTNVVKDIGTSELGIDTASEPVMVLNEDAIENTEAVDVDDVLWSNTG